MSKSFSASIVVAIAALGAAGLAQAQGADGPSYPALKPIQSVSSRAQVQSSAHKAIITAGSGPYAGGGDGATYPALQAHFASQKSRAEVGAEARTVLGAAIVIGSDDRYGA